MRPSFFFPHSMKNLLLIGTLLLAMVPTIANTANVSETVNPAVNYAVEQNILPLSLDGVGRSEGRVNRLEFTLATLHHLYPNEDVENCYSNISPSQPVSYMRLFSDVETTTWYGQDLCVGMHVGIIQGNRDGTFRPFAAITTAEAAKILAKAYGLAYGSAQNAAWFKQSMDVLSERGALPKNAGPDAAVTRLDMAKMFYAMKNVAPLTMTPLAVTGAENSSAMGEMPSAQKPVESTQWMNQNDSLAMDEDCIDAISANSPGAALMILGQSAHPRTGIFRSRRLLRVEVEKNYQSGTLVTHTQNVRMTSTFARCGLLSIHSPGMAMFLQRTVSSSLDMNQRPSKRSLEQSAWERMQTKTQSGSSKVGY